MDDFTQTMVESEYSTCYSQDKNKTSYDIDCYHTGVYYKGQVSVESYDQLAENYLVDDEEVELFKSIAVNRESGDTALIIAMDRSVVAITKSTDYFTQKFDSWLTFLRREGIHYKFGADVSHTDVHIQTKKVDIDPAEAEMISLTRNICEAVKGLQDDLHISVNQQSRGSHNDDDSDVSPSSPDIFETYVG